MVTAFYLCVKALRQVPSLCNSPYAKFFNGAYLSLGTATCKTYLRPLLLMCITVYFHEGSKTFEQKSGSVSKVATFFLFISISVCNFETCYFVWRKLCIEIDFCHKKIRKEKLPQTRLIVITFQVLIQCLDFSKPVNTNSETGHLQTVMSVAVSTRYIQRSPFYSLLWSHRLSHISEFTSMQTFITALHLACSRNQNHGMRHMPIVLEVRRGAKAAGLISN